MNKLRLKIWLIVTIALPIAAVIIRLIWQYVVIPTTNLAMLIMLILAFLGIYALFVYLTLKPGLKKLKTPLVRILVTASATGGIISGIIHMMRFIPSPECGPPLSIIMVGLYLVAGFSAYVMLLWFIWSGGKGGEG